MFCPLIKSTNIIKYSQFGHVTFYQQEPKFSTSRVYFPLLFLQLLSNIDRHNLIMTLLYVGCRSSSLCQTAKPGHIPKQFCKGNLSSYRLGLSPGFGTFYNCSSRRKVSYNISYKLFRSSNFDFHYRLKELNSCFSGTILKCCARSNVK